MSEPLRIETVATGMITLRGDPGSRDFTAAAEAVTGVSLPAQRAVSTANNKLLWMSPDELLLLCPPDATQKLVRDLRQALQGVHHLVADVSDARILMRISGATARECLAQGAPVDLAPRRFEPGMIRRSRIGQIAAAFWMTGPETFEIICFRSVADHLRAWLEHAARPGAAPEIFVA